MKKKLTSMLITLAICTAAVLSSCNSASEANDTPSEEEAVLTQQIVETVPVYTPQLTVLMYHDITTDISKCENDWVVTADSFRDDLIWLRDNGYTTVFPSELASGKLSNGDDLPENCVLITFDDGYESNYSLAYPILCETQSKAAIALIGQRIDSKVSGFMDWDKCREMAQSGFVEFGSHTYDHHIRDNSKGLERMEGEETSEYLARIEGDLSKSVDVITKELGVSPTYFAYPLGVVEPLADELVQKYFSLSVTSEPATPDLTQGVYKLPRYNVSERRQAKDILPYR